MSSTRRFIVTPDKHFPLADKAAINALCKIIIELRPDGYIDLGDTGEWSSVSKWKWKNSKKPNLEWYLPEVITEVDEVNKGMDQIDEALDRANVKEKHFCQGNHELWLDYFVEQFPYLPQYGCKKAMKIEERGYRFHRAGKLLKIHDMSFYHGHNYGGIHHAAKHCKEYKTNIMYGHHHDVQVYTDKKDGDPITAWSIGCLKSLKSSDNEFCSGRPLNWVHAIAVVDFIGREHFVKIITIKDGKYRL